MNFGSILGGGQEISVFFKTSTATLQPSQLPIQVLPGATSEGLKRTEGGADHKPPSSV
jgi:hypothetical protein